MNAIVKFFGIVIVMVVITFLTLEYQKKIIITNDLRESIKTTQTKVIYDALNLGDLRVNNKLSIDKDLAIENWYTTFNLNRDLNLNYEIKIVDINSFPPLIAVSVKAYTDRSLSEKKLISNYDNIIICDR